MGTGVKPAPVSSSTPYCDLFEEVFPHYLARGMSYAEFWEMDPTMVIAFRRADECRQERANEQAWLQGFYFYSAMGAVSPILHAFAKEGTRAKPYLPEPLEIRKPRQVNTPDKPRDLQKMENGKTAMRAFMADINKKFEKKGVGENAECGRSGTQNPG